MKAARTIKALALCFLLLLHVGVQAACACEFASFEKSGEQVHTAGHAEPHHGMAGHEGMQMGGNAPHMMPCHDNSADHDCPFCGSGAALEDHYLVTADTFPIPSTADGYHSITYDVIPTVQPLPRYVLAAPRSPPPKLFTPITLKTLLRL